MGGGGLNRLRLPDGQCKVLVELAKDHFSRCLVIAIDQFIHDPVEAALHINEAGLQFGVRLKVHAIAFSRIARIAAGRVSVAPFAAIQRSSAAT